MVARVSWVTWTSLSRGNGMASSLPWRCSGLSRTLVTIWSITSPRTRPMVEGISVERKPFLSSLDVHFVNPSPVFCLDNPGDDGHPHTIRYGYLAWLQTRITSMPVPYAPPVTLADEERRQLEALARAHATPQALAFRCRLILRTAAPDRPPNLRVAVELHCDRHTVRLWRTRYLAQGLAGLQDAPRTGRPRRISPL